MQWTINKVLSHFVLKLDLDVLAFDLFSVSIHEENEVTPPSDCCPQDIETTLETSALQPDANNEDIEEGEEGHKGQGHPETQEVLRRGSVAPGIDMNLLKTIGTKDR